MKQVIALSTVSDLCPFGWEDSRLPHVTSLNSRLIHLPTGVPLLLQPDIPKAILAHWHQDTPHLTQC